MPLTIRSPAFTDGGEIPSRFTCEGEDVSPALEWSGVPEGTKSLALVVEDPDAPDPKAPKMVYVHWVLWGLPPTEKGLPEGVAASALPKGAHEGLNDWKRPGYGGPCPPIGRHRYYFRLYALSDVIEAMPKATRATLLDATKGKIVEEAVVMGTYQKQKR